jgi:hypothetical protein
VRTPDVAYYREEANRCRKLAAASPDSEAAKRWRQLAQDYDQLAEALELGAAGGRAAFQRVPMQQQEIQQQQQKKAEEPDKEG